MRVRQKFHSYVRGLCQADAIPDPPNRYVRVAFESMTRFVEIDEDGVAVRKVEVFTDGRSTYAWAKGSTGTTTLEARTADDAASAIDRPAFELVWDQALEFEDP